MSSVLINFIQSITRADEYFNALLLVSRDVFLVKIFTVITLLGEISTIVLFTLIASLVLWRIDKKWQILGLLLSVVGSAGTTFLAKMFFDRPRPPSAAILETSASFPSGHATIAVAFYGFIIYLLLTKIKQPPFAKATEGSLFTFGEGEKRDRILVILLGSILILLIGFSRLYLGVHYMSDVLVGYLVGGLWLIVGIKLVRFCQLSFPRRRE